MDVFTKNEVLSLNAYQRCGYFHPFTCGGVNHPKDVQAELVAEKDGWHCPVCDYRQDWAHSWMKDWSWSRHLHGWLPLREQDSR